MAASLAQTAGSLLLVLAVIFGLAWVLRRMQGLRGASSRLLSVSGALQLGPRERIAIVRVGEQHFLVGVTQGSVNLLHRFDKAPEASEFDAVLRKS